MKPALLFSLLLFLNLAACTNNKREEPQPFTTAECKNITYSANVFPIIQQTCAITGCHIAGFPDGDFTRFEDLKDKVNNGSFKNSVIDGNAPVMPETGKLPDAQIQVLQCWLKNGAPNN
jgi:hypothetical protein